MTTIYNAINTRTDIQSTAEERMQTERMHRLMDGETEIKRKMMSPARAAANNAKIGPGPWRWKLV